MGYDAVCDSYMGLCVPADTPDEIVEVLRDACATAFEDAAFQEIMTNTNQAPAYMTGDEYEALVGSTTSSTAPWTSSPPADSYSSMKMRRRANWFLRRRLILPFTRYKIPFHLFIFHFSKG